MKTWSKVTESKVSLRNDPAVHACEYYEMGCKESNAHKDQVNHNK